MKLIITTPTGELFSSQDVEILSLETMAGQIVIKDDHENLMTALTAGEVMVEIEGKSDPVGVAVSAGLVEVKDNLVKILAETAIKANDIDIKAAEEARNKAEEILSQPQTAETKEIDYVKLQQIIATENAKIKVGKKYRNLPAGSGNL